MPQMDKEIFIEYFLGIFVIAIQSFSNETLSENFLKINARYSLFSWFILEKSRFEQEISFFEGLYKLKSLQQIKK